MDEARRDSVSRAFANMGKAIAAYEKTLHHEKSRLDAYLDEAVNGNPAGLHTLDAREVNGLRWFIV